MFVKLRRLRHSKNKSGEDENDADEETKYVKVLGNEIYFSGEINEDSIHELNTTLRKVQIDMITKATAIGVEPPGILLYIRSDGGCLFSGLSAMDHINSMKIPVTTIVDGWCCSAATFLLLGGHRRLMRKNSYVLIHQLSSTIWGKFEELRDEMNAANKFMDHIKRIYKQETKLTDKKLNKLMKRDIYLDFDECMRYGIISGSFPLLAGKTSPENEGKECDDGESN